MFSINARLFVTTSLVLAFFFGLTGAALDQSFRENAQSAVRDRLQWHVYALIAGSYENDHGELKLFNTSHFENLGSAFYGQVISNNGLQMWKSSSLKEQSLPVYALAPAEERFVRVQSVHGGEIFLYSLGLTWDGSDKATEGYTYSVAEYVNVYDGQLLDFRKRLWGWLTSIAILFLFVHVFLVRWGLAPLRRAASELLMIEKGERLRIEGDYPREMTGLTDNLNALLHSEREHRERYRDTLADLAHSLKTPLAVLRNSLSSDAIASNEIREEMGDQLDRMNQIVEHQLQRAAAAGRRVLVEPITIKPSVEKLVRALEKVYAEKGVSCEVAMSDSDCFYGDEGDFMEVLGNLSDNAFKWCESRVRISVQFKNTPEHKRPDLLLVVEDDGPGVPVEQVQHILQRGVRGDTAIPGHGIGLDVTHDIAHVYGGELGFEESALGGAKIVVRFPQE